MKIGVRITGAAVAPEKIAEAAGYGFHSCQVCNWDASQCTEENAVRILAACEKYDMSISTLWVGWSGPARWNFTEGPMTLGLYPGAYRHTRVRELKIGADFAKRLGVSQIATHAGFIPENPLDPGFEGMMDALREVAEYCEQLGLKFLFETGQETPTALLRAFEVIGTQNLGLNLDTANVILYGKANPVDVMKVMGKYVYDLHIKDGCWPTDGWHLGKEVQVGQGDVDFPTIIRMLKELGYDGALTIEREISGDQQTADIIETKKNLEKWIAEV